jgi:hypothetical protein
VLACDFDLFDDITLLKLSSSSSNMLQCRVLYYVFMAAVRDEEIQKTGVVLIYNLIRQGRFYENRPSKIAKFFWLIPVQLVGLHSCHNSHLFDVAIKLMAKSIEGHLLCRYQSHFGT